MTNYHYRKYEGAPHSEKKKAAPKEPSKLAPRGKKRRKDVVCTSMYTLGRKHDGGGFFDCIFCLHVGAKIRMWGCYHALEHVVRRMKANLLRDTRTKLYWVEHAVLGALSPEFHDFENAMNWIVYKGLQEGWLYVERSTYTHYKTGEEYRIVRLACR